MSQTPEYSLIELRKLFYREKHVAHFLRIRKGVALYICTILDEDENEVQTVYFEIPVAEMGEATFGDVMECKHLTHWLI